MTAPVQEGDMMECRSCGAKERASEGYPCAGCGTFICIVCEMRNIARCRDCQAKAGLPPAPKRLSRS